MTEKTDRLKKWMNGGEAPPTTMEINITNRCNLKCLSCWQRSGNINYDELSSEKWLEIVKDAGEMGVEEIRIPGSGEPLIRSDLVLDIMEESKKYGMNGLIITNGTLWTDELVEKAINVGWDNVTFSIDAPDAETHDYLRGMDGAFDKAMKWLRKFKHMKRKMDETLPLLRLNVVLSNENFDKLDRMMEFAHINGCDSLSLQPMTIFSPLGERLKLNDEQIKELPENIKRAKRIADKYSIYTNVDDFVDSDIVKKTNKMDEVIAEKIDDYSNEFLSLPCFEPWYNIIIMPNGTMGPCSMFGGEKGISLKNKSLSEVWYGEYFTNIRKRLLNKNLFDFCKNCCVVVFEENKKIRGELSK